MVDKYNQQIRLSNYKACIFDVLTIFIAKMLSPYLILSCIALYFIMLLLIAYFTSRNANNTAYFTGNKASIWYLVAFGMIGDSLSGLTYLSVPGSVEKAQFNYLQIVLGYVVGYWAISYILLPLYYRLNLTSIYAYLQNRIGKISQLTGSFFFILSRLIGAGGRLFLAAIVLQKFVFDSFNMPFPVTVLIIILLILVYTLKGGIKTLVWTDAFQSFFLLMGVICTIWFIGKSLNLSIGDMYHKIVDYQNNQVFFWDWKPKNFFFKQFIGGAFIAICMTGLDQNMMQKNLSCRSLGEAQKNINMFSIIVLIVNMFFLVLGALLYIYIAEMNIPAPAIADELFPTLAFGHLGMAAGLIFVIGLTAATFNSADSVLTTLTTSFYIDFLHKNQDEAEQNKKLRLSIHAGFAVILYVVVMLFSLSRDQSLVFTVLDIAGITYGPLLGLFTFGILTNRKAIDKIVPFICIFSALLCTGLYWASKQKAAWLGGYVVGAELLIINGFITFLILLLTSKKSDYGIRRV